MYSIGRADTMSEHTTQTMKDVNHTPPAGESVTNVWNRGRDDE